MQYFIIMGSPRKNGNTYKLIKIFTEELENQQAQHDLVWLYDKHIEPCIACRRCQADWSVFGCHYKDDVQEIYDNILACNVLVLATPIYSWYCTPPMKALLDRLVYGMNKYYGTEKGPSLWKGKKVALITTCGYRPEKGSDLFEIGMQRYCQHSQLEFKGMLSERDLGYQHTFMDDIKEARTREFALDLLKSEGLFNLYPDGR